MNGATAASRGKPGRGQRGLQFLERLEDARDGLAEEEGAAELVGDVVAEDLGEGACLGAEERVCRQEGRVGEDVGEELEDRHRLRELRGLEGGLVWRHFGSSEGKCGDLA